MHKYLRKEWTQYLFPNEKEEGPPPKKSTKKHTNKTGNSFHTRLSSRQLAKMVKLCKSKRYRKAAKSLLRDDVADPNDRITFELLQNLHPQRECNYEELKNSYLEEIQDDAQESRWERREHQTIKEEQMLTILDKIVKGLKDDKAVGPTNWNNGAIKQCYKKAPHFRKALAVIALDMEDGKFPYPNLLTDAFLIGIWKNPEHTGIRPIAIANNLSKVLITAAWKHRMSICGMEQLPIQHNQFGISVSCGAELPAFVVSEYYKQKTLLKTISLDITNAFNSISREQIIRQVAKRLPPLLPLVELLYLHDSRLYTASGQIIYSKQGVRQGCPLSPLLFSLAIDEIVEEENKIADEYGAQVVAYLDDHTFIQEKTKAKKELTLDIIIERIQPLLNNLHLELNKKKCYTFEPLYEDPMNSPPTTTPNKITKIANESEPTVAHDGVVLLGIPIGTEDFINKFVTQELEEKTRLIDRLVELPVQIAYHMLRLVIAPSTNFLARALGDRGYFERWDERIYYAVFSLANQTHDYIMYVGAARENWDDPTIEEVFSNFERLERAKVLTIHSRDHFYLARDLVWLNSRRGGLGIIITTKMANDAWIASHLTSIATLSSRNIDFSVSEETLNAIRNYIPQLDALEFKNIFLSNHQLRDICLSEVVDLQKKLTGLTQEKLKQDIITTLKTEEEFKNLFYLFEDHQGEHANRVLIKPPSFTKTYVIENRVMQEIITQTLLLPNDLNSTLCHSNTGEVHNCVFANHMNACSYTGSIALRHTRIKRELAKVCRVLNLPVKYEQQLAKGKVGTRYRADLYLPTLNVLIDVTCVQMSQKSRTSLEQAMRAKYEEKDNYYIRMESNQELLDQFYETGTTLIPVVFGPRGQMYSESWRVLTRVLHLNDPRATITEARGQIPLVMNTVEPGKIYTALSILRAISFHVAVETATGALNWQERQRLHWKMEMSKLLLNPSKRPRTSLPNPNYREDDSSNERKKPRRNSYPDDKSQSDDEENDKDL